jgi:hypothetical protein
MKWTGLTRNEIIVLALIGVAVVICLVYLKKWITKYLKERKERKKKEAQKEMGRGEILIRSMFIELIVVAILCVSPCFLPIGIIWKILIIGLGLILTLVMDFFLIYLWWAPNNLFFTFVKEGTVKTVVKGHKFYKALVQFKGYRLNNPKTMVAVVRGVDKKHWFGGLRYYGLWPVMDIFVYPFQWTGITEGGKLEPHEIEWLDYIYVKDDIYGFEVLEAEDKELMPLNIILTFTVRIINPYKALFVIENWYETLINRSRPYVRDFLTTGTYREFIADPQRIGIGISQRLEEEEILKELKGRYGIDIRKIEVNAINPANKEFRDATMEKVLAERKKEAVIVQAEAEKRRLEIVAEGEKGRIDTEYGAVEKFGFLGEKVRSLEALEKSPGKGSKVVVIPADLVSLASNVKKIISG